MHAFFKELRHGRVYRAAVSYAVVSWLILQLAAIVGPALGLPPWTLTATLGALLCGFTAALWVGWLQDHRRALAGVGAVPVRARRHHFLFAAISVIPAVAVAGMFLWRHHVAAGSAHDGLPPILAAEKSIAVLPFENLSDDKSNVYFTEGIQDEILTDLAHVADLKVISRTSVTAYGPGHAASVREIGLALGVTHLLEGSVQRAAGRVRVVAQLIDARNDAHLWADHYDRDLSDVFSIQSELAERIVASLRATLLPDEKAAINARPTNDLAAYDLYLRAREILSTYQSTPDWRETLSGAVRLLDEATARDPDFALAHCLTAKAHDNLYYLFDPTPSRLVREEAAVAEALRLRPASGEAHLAHALALYHGRHDYPAARRELAVARAALPNCAEVYVLTSYVDRREGRWQDAVPNLERARTLDPRNFDLFNDRMMTYDMLRLYAPEMRVADEGVAALPPSANYFRLLKAQAQLSCGRTAAASEELAALPAGYDPEGLATYTRLCVALYERRPAEAAAVAAAFTGTEYSGFNGTMTPRAWMEALAARAAGDGARVYAVLQRARPEAEANVRQRPNDPGSLALLGQIDAGLGRKAEALDEGRRAVAMCPVATDAMNGPAMSMSLALIQAWVGDTDAAMERLLELEKMPGGPDYGQLRSDPAWDPVRGKPGFAEMLARLDPHMGQ